MLYAAIEKTIVNSEDEMSNNSESLFKQQRKTRPKVEDMICKYFEGDMKQNALDFVTWLRANKLSPRFAATNAWYVYHENDNFMQLRIDSKEWPTVELKPEKIAFCICFSAYTAFHNVLLNTVELKEAVIAGIKPCTDCSPNCERIEEDPVATVCGEKIENVCVPYYLVFNDPSAEIIARIKDVILYTRGRGAKA